ncbi:hypothetical protein UFOVP190_72 [uncultured Caudovirales phage]|uniref:Uncharacterized protein n=1 Tax=uncultured Caudovirales phage TaxID=2100421 RepID=A0A6J7WJV8_9CAUD|nr:hypothetical protein UFOVP190_72 [uncultured Caudovirales phage]
MTAQEFLEQVQKAMSGKTDVSFDPKNIEDFQKQIKATIDNLKKSQPGLKQFSDFLDGTKQPLNDVTKEIDALNKAIKEARASKNVEQQASLEGQKEELKAVAIKKNVVAGFTNLGIGVASLANSMYEGTRDLVKSLQSGASGVEIATQASMKAARLTGEAGKITGEFGKSMGLVVSLIGGPWVKVIGLAITALSSFVEWFSGKAAKVAEDAAELLGKELEKTQKGFKEITQAGALFGGGMTEMRQQAFRAGMDIAMLAEAVKLSRADLIDMGIGMGEAIKKVAGVSKELRSSDLGIQLRKLGYGAEEQAALAAQVMANQNAAGNLRALSDKELAKITAEYGKDLRILADITGQDAKKAMEKARLQAMEADLLAQAMAEGGPEAVKKLQVQLATMPESMKKGYMEFVSSGGQAVVDMATNVAMTQNPKILDQYRQQFATLSDRTKIEHDALIESGKLSESTVQYARDNNARYKEIGQAARLGNDPTAKAITDFQNGLILDETRRKKGATVQAEANAAAAAANQAPLDVAVANLNEAADRMRAQIGDKILPALVKFASGIDAIVGTIEENLAKFGITKEKPAPKPVSTAPGAQANNASGTTQNNGNLAATSVTRDSRPVNPNSLRGKRTVIAGGAPGQAVDDLITDYGPLTPFLRGNGFVDGVPEAVAGGGAKKELVDAVYKLVQAYPGSTVNALNDAHHQQRYPNSKHAFGKAADLGIPGLSPEVLKDIQTLVAGMKAEIHPNDSGSGSHLHVEMMRDGGIVTGTGGGINARIGEAGTPELVQPLRNGRIPGMDEMIDKLDQMLSVMKDHKSVSENIFNATA